ncbi:MAG: hypothetical protein IPK68_09130 [Bdellovibrionales bacterium]|nr:hypothetical protein [Bdellovibrionales bacterium]
MAKKQRIQIKCRGAESVPYDKLNPLQGNLKDLSDENYSKLKKEILELGFSEPISVWENDGKLFSSKWSSTTPGHQANGGNGVLRVSTASDLDH